MAEELVKTLLYFRPTASYWQLTDPERLTRVRTEPLGRWPLDLIPRLNSRHFCNFDPEGIPVDPAHDGGGFVHNYTTISAFALAHWDAYLTSADEAHLVRMLRCAEYALRTGDRSEPGSLKLQAELPGAGHVGMHSAMFQGEVISVLCRAWQITEESRYLEAAVDCLRSLEVPVEEGGVLGEFSRFDVPWYEEDPALPLKHILNGMIYTLWGLGDLVKVSGDHRARRLYETGLESVIRALPAFDTGYWSWYWVPEAGERHYIASMMYHNLHICQLRALGRQSGRAELEAVARLYEGYADQYLCRLRAAAAIFGAKFRPGRLARKVAGFVKQPAGSR